MSSAGASGAESGAAHDSLSAVSRPQIAFSYPQNRFRGYRPECGARVFELAPAFTASASSTPAAPTL